MDRSRGRILGDNMRSLQNHGVRNVAEIESVREFRPELAAAIESYHEFAASMVDPAVVELCKLRIAQIQRKLNGAIEPSPATRAAGLTDGQLRDLAFWQGSDQFDAQQKACLELAEYFCYTAQGVTDEQVEHVAEHLSTEQILTLTAGLWVTDASTRLATYLDSLGV